MVGRIIWISSGFLCVLFLSVLSAGADVLEGNRTPNEVLEAGNKHYSELEEPEKALAYYQYFVEAWPEHEEAFECQKNVVLANMTLGNVEAAETGVDKMIADFSWHENLYRAIQEIANRYRTLNNHQMARRYFNYVIQNDPNSDAATWAKVNLVRSYITMVEEERAQSLIDRLFAVSDGDKTKAKGALILAEDYRYIYRSGNAKPLFEYFVENDPNHPDARDVQTQIAYIYEGFKDYNAAETATLEFIAKYPNHSDTPNFIYNMAFKFRKDKKYEKVLPLLDFIIANYPKDPYCEQAWMEKAVIGWDSSNELIAEQVVSKFKAELSENPATAKAFRMLADQCALRWDADKAREIYQYIIDHSQDGEEVLQCQMGQAMVSIDWDDEAAAQAGFEALLADVSGNPKRAELLHILGNKCQEFEYYGYAAAAYRKLIEVAPNSYEAAIAQKAIGWCCIKRGLYEEAITEFRKVVENYPESERASGGQYWVAQSYYKKGDYAQAAEEYQKVIDNYPES
ncbi:MAG: tol-pal system YbgF family protein [Planctomycetota bacterium]|jgi:tetratricopeptide (TPR) repeat protein